MMEGYQPNYVINDSILAKVSEISQKEGELRTARISAQDKIEIMSLANIDAVHFSTKLEGNSLTYDQVTDVLEGKIKKSKLDRDLNEVLNYSRARYFLFEKAKKNKQLDKHLILDTHKILLAKISEGKLKGFYRNAQNVIRDSKSKAIVYLPPEANDVDALMKNLINWLNKAIINYMSPLVVAPIFHYYFVTIHPFLDGNGRAARLLTNYILLANNITISEYSALEKQHEKNRQLYYKNLRSLQAQTFYDIPKDINLTTWLEYWLGCLNSAYDEALIRSKQLILDEKLEHLENRLQKAISLFKKHKILKAREYQSLMGLGRTQAVNDLNKLAQHKFIKRQGGGRSQTYRHFEKNA